MPPADIAPRSHLAAFVVLGGVVGSALRVGAYHLFPARDFPWPTVAVNLTGALVVGWLLPTLHSRTRRRRRVAFGAIGVAGAFTTFATFAVDVVRLVDVGRLATAGWFALVSLVGGVIAAAIGHAVGERA
jgi:CrcB protein